MKKISMFLLLASLAFARVESVDVTPENVSKFDQIVDIRSAAEWRNTGVIKGAKLLTFDPTKKDEFISELGKIFDLKKPVAIICQSGRRSANAASLLDSPDLEIINLNGGMGALIRAGFKTEPY